MNASWADVRLLLISFVTMLMGVLPGFTTDTLRNSPPRSTAIRGPHCTRAACRAAAV